MGNEYLPENWSESHPGGMATNKDPLTGGIIDKAIVDGKWFIIFHDESFEALEGIESRDDAFRLFHETLMQKQGDIEEGYQQKF